MTAVTTFSLATLVRAELEINRSPDPGDVAAAVLSQVPDEHLRDALSEVLREYVRGFIRAQRVIDSPKQTAPVANASPKITLAREAWRLHLRERYHVAGSQWRFLGDMTRDDLLAAAEERRVMAVQNVHQADRLLHWADLVAQHKVESFGQLPPAVLQAELS